MKLCCGEGLIAGRPITPISKPSFVTDESADCSSACRSPKAGRRALRPKMSSVMSKAACARTNQTRRTARGPDVDERRDPGWPCQVLPKVRYVGIWCETGGEARAQVSRLGPKTDSGCIAPKKGALLSCGRRDAKPPPSGLQMSNRLQAPSGLLPSRLASWCLSAGDGRGDRS